MRCQPAAQELVGAVALARAGGARAAELRARRLPRRRAHLDRQPTSTARPARRSTSAAARTCSARCSRRSRSATRSPRARPLTLRGACARPRRSLGAVAASTEIFAWMVRNPEQPRREGARQAGSRAPAPARDRRADPRAARGRRGRARRVPRARAWQSSTQSKSGSRPRSSTSPSRRCGRATTPTRTSTTRARRCSQDGRHPRVVMQVFQKNDSCARRDGRGDRDPQALLARLGRS